MERSIPIKKVATLVIVKSKIKSAFVQVALLREVESELVDEVKNVHTPSGGGYEHEPSMGGGSNTECAITYDWPGPNSTGNMD